jgi:hypothetical protein
MTKSAIDGGRPRTAFLVRVFSGAILAEESAAERLEMREVLERFVIRDEEVAGDLFATAFTDFSSRAAFVREACVFILDMRSLLDLKPINQPPPRGDMAQYLAENTAANLGVPNPWQHHNVHSLTCALKCASES